LRSFGRAAYSHAARTGCPGLRAAQDRRHIGCMSKTAAIENDNFPKRWRTRLSLAGSWNVAGLAPCLGSVKPGAR